MTPSPEAVSSRARFAAGLCLAVPVLAALVVPLYDRETPQLFGFPFFYWYQFALMIVTTAAIWAAGRLLGTREETATEGDADTRETDVAA